MKNWKLYRMIETLQRQLNSDLFDYDIPGGGGAKRLANCMIHLDKKDAFWLTDIKNMFSLWGAD